MKSVKTKLTTLAVIASLGALGVCADAVAQEQTNQFVMNWVATGYTVNAAGKMVVTNVSAQTFINKVALDNNLNPKELVFVYRVERGDTAVVYRSNGYFVADAYQLSEYYSTSVTNATGSVICRQTAIDDEYHNDAQGNPFPLGWTFGVESKIYNRAGYLTQYSYHGTFNYSLPENNAIFVGSFSTGARINDLNPDDD
jgi:hypothetical protein